ncbi:MAG: hypothetical protein QOI68_473, partial [Pseudonocardiales bacterium]|nr:hypothetical protein [Pseudonocardiales bacterium]
MTTWMFATAARTSTGFGPFFVDRSTMTDSSARNAVTAASRASVRT